MRISLLQWMPQIYAHCVDRSDKLVAEYIPYGNISYDQIALLLHDISLSP